MAEQAKVPSIRFAGFTDPWEQRKFGELYRPVSEKNDLSFGRDKAISVANMYFNPAVYVTEDSYLATYNVMRLGDIAFEGNRSKRFAHGRFVENTIGDGIVSHVFKVFRHVGDNYDLSYWKHAINNEKLMKDVLTRSTKASTMMHELVTADFLEELTLVPSLNEQRAIGAAIDSIDNLITLHQRKRQWLKWLDEGGEGTHHDIDILVFKFADDMKISVLCGVHACMTKSLGHTGNRYAGKQQQRGMGVP